MPLSSASTRLGLPVPVFPLSRARPKLSALLSTVVVVVVTVDDWATSLERLWVIPEGLQRMLGRSTLWKNTCLHFNLITYSIEREVWHIRLPTDTPPSLLATLILQFNWLIKIVKWNNIFGGKSSSHRGSPLTWQGIHNHPQQMSVRCDEIMGMILGITGVVPTHTEVEEPLEVSHLYMSS